MKQISMADNIENIPDDKFFAVKGKHIKVFLYLHGDFGGKPQGLLYNESQAVPV